MAAPNIVNVSSIYGKLAVQAISTSPADIVTNSANSNTVVKINALYISNVDGTNDQTVNVEIIRSGTGYHLANTVNVPADSTLDVINKSIYLEEGDSLRLSAGDNSDLEGVCSYEVIS